MPVIYKSQCLGISDTKHKISSSKKREEVSKQMNAVECDHCYDGRKLWNEEETSGGTRCFLEG